MKMERKEVKSGRAKRRMKKSRDQAERVAPAMDSSLLSTAVLILSAPGVYPPFAHTKYIKPTSSGPVGVYFDFHPAIFSLLLRSSG